MNRLLLDTNIYIEYYNSGRFYDIVYQRRWPDVIYVSVIVIMELLAGAFTKTDIEIVRNLLKVARAADKIVVPLWSDFVEADRLLARLQKEMGYDIKKAFRLTNDILIALSARQIGATVITQNRRDFEAIRTLKDFRLEVVE